MGKTNIIYVEKDQSTGMQFIKEYISTKTTEDIVGMRYLNGMLFALTDKHVLYGKDADSLEYVMFDGALLEVNDVQFYEGRYLFFNNSKWFQNDQPAETLELIYYTGADPASLEPSSLIVALTKNAEQDGALKKVEVSSDGKLIFLIWCSWKDVSLTARAYILKTMSGWDAESQDQVMVKDSKGSYGVGNIFFMRDRFCIERSATNAQNSSQVLTLDGLIKDASSVPVTVIGDVAYYIVSEKVYYSINFVDTVLIREPKTTAIAGDPQRTGMIIPIGGRIGLYSDKAKILWLADSLSDIKDDVMEQIELAGLSDYRIYSYVEADGYTYLGCSSGIITKCSLDVEGDYQLPEVILVKALAARQALTQAKAYTDQKFAELKDYVDNLSSIKV